MTIKADEGKQSKDPAVMWRSAIATFVNASVDALATWIQHEYADETLHEVHHDAPIAVDDNGRLISAAALLGIKLGATTDEIRAAFRERVKAELESGSFHDQGGGMTDENAQRLIAAKNLLIEFGDLRLDEISLPEIKRFKAQLVQPRKVGKQLSDKRINNILCVLSKALRYAFDAELIDHVPRIGLHKVERPEIEPWGFDEYARLLRAAEEEGGRWCAAVCLAGEAGLRVGEVKALRWREDVDIIGGTITVNRQTRRGIIGTPKGRTRRTIPMTDRLLAALKAIPTVREGLIVTNWDGTPVSDMQGQSGLRRICRRAGLPERPWHVLRHTFATQAAMFGVNPWSLQSWMGHKRIEETMIYVSYANAHKTPIPASVLGAGARELDPDRRILAMLGARSAAASSLGSVNVAETAAGESENRVELRLVT